MNGTIVAAFMLQALSFEIFTLRLPVLNTNSLASLSTAKTGYTLAVMHANPSPPKLSIIEWSICKQIHMNLFE